MAWNQPGGDGNNQDPWGKKRPNNQNDLDKMIKEAGDKFGKMFGGKGGQGANSGKSFFVIGLVVLVAFYVIKGFYTVKEAEQGVITRFGAYDRTVEPGLGWMPWGIDRLYKVDVNTVKPEYFSGTMLTRNKNIVDVKLSVQYRVSVPEDYLFNVNKPDSVLKHATDAALRKAVGNSNIDEVLKDNKTGIMAMVQEEINKTIGPLEMGITVIEVNLQESEAPAAVREAFDDVNRSINDKKRYEEQARAYENQVIPTAEAEAETMMQAAEAYRQRVIAEAKGEVARFAKLLPEYEAAKEVTRQRLYLETVEQVMSKVSKVILDTEGGSNLTYLPLDQIVNKKKSNKESK
ncbi:FtsH protease activity modulator HflK [Kangiella sp. HZ709]|uniref:FtsH protease activity modulator HflK n=1 Tax=Kangiella sp. HZ709 TaxID=2666328 RepID=UPI0012B08DD3|nr:FtsH protease activity modulator HflK [Kangiella sp. HZ709]MRX27567.1 FtsH protease activity modulator HflK [Kangiella sp. HZ709]